MSRRIHPRRLQFEGESTSVYLPGVRSHAAAMRRHVPNEDHLLYLQDDEATRVLSFLRVSARRSVVSRSSTPASSEASRARRCSVVPTLRCAGDGVPRQRTFVGRGHRGDTGGASEARRP